MHFLIAMFDDDYRGKRELRWYHAKHSCKLLAIWFISQWGHSKSPTYIAIHTYTCTYLHRYTHRKMLRIT